MHAKYASNGENASMPLFSSHLIYIRFFSMLWVLISHFFTAAFKYSRPSEFHGEQTYSPKKKMVGVSYYFKKKFLVGYSEEFSKKL